MLTYRVVALSFSSARNIGNAEKSRIRLCWSKRRQRNSPFSPNLCNSSATASTVFSEPGSRISFVYLINSRYCLRLRSRPVCRHCQRMAGTVWTTTLPSITVASCTCTVKQHIICVCRDLPDRIHATPEPSESRRRASVRRAIPGKRKRPRSFLCKHGKY